MLFADLHRRLIESVSEGVCLLDREGQILFANQRLAFFLGMTTAELSGRSAFEFITAENRPEAKERLANCFAGRRDLSILKLCRPNGKLLLMRSSGAPLDPASSPVIAVVVVLSDITAQVAARKKTERARRESEQRFRRLYDSRIIGIITGDEETILEANDLFLEMVGYKREDLEAGRLNWVEMTAPDYRALSGEAVHDIKTKTFAGPFEKEYLRKDGSRIPVLLGATLLQKKPYRDLCFVLDLTQRKKLEKQVLETQKLESVSLLAAGIAHQFNNLLVGVIGNAGLSRGMLPPDHPARQMMERVLEAGQQAAYLTRQLLAYCGKGAFQVETLDPASLFRELADFLQPSLSKKISLELACEPGCVIAADRGHMQQIFTNLIWNAAEAIGDSRGVITVRCEACQISRADVQHTRDWEGLEPGRYVRISVSDTGCGMDEATRSRIYDPFFSTKFMGRGLGLAAVAGIVRSQRGAISVTSSPGHGSEFNILLPAGELAAGES